MKIYNYDDDTALLFWSLKIYWLCQEINFVLFCQNISSDLIKTDEAYFGGKLFSLDSFNQMINQNKMDI